jgi:hypothetical protein
MEPLWYTSELVDDVKLIVLEYVRSTQLLFCMALNSFQVLHVSDIQALCLASKSWNHIATAHLYRHITINIQSQESQLACFEECMLGGAMSNLRFAQSLTMYETACFPELSTSDGQNPVEELETARQEDILRLLQLFPDNKLCSFRYGSPGHERQLHRPAFVTLELRPSSQRLSSSLLTPCSEVVLVNALATLTNMADRYSSVLPFSKACIHYVPKSVSGFNQGYTYRWMPSI